MARDFNGSNQYLLKDSPVLTAPPLTMACFYYAHNITTTGCQIGVGDLGSAVNRLSLQTRGQTVGDPLTFQIRNDAATIVSG